MKTILRRPCVLSACLILIYLLGLGVGLTAIGIYPVYHKQKPGLLAENRAIVQVPFQDAQESILFLRSATTRVLFYEADGERLFCIATDRSDSGETYDAILER